MSLLILQVRMRAHSSYGNADNNSNVSPLSHDLEPQASQIPKVWDLCALRQWLDMHRTLCHQAVS